MFADVDEVLCQRAKWSLRLLVPSWAAYVCILLGLIGLFSHRLAETVNNWEETDKTGDLPEVEMVSVSAGDTPMISMWPLTRCIAGR